MSCERNYLGALRLYIVLFVCLFAVAAGTGVYCALFFFFLFFFVLFFLHFYVFLVTVSTVCCGFVCCRLFFLLLLFLPLWLLPTPCCCCCLVLSCLSCTTKSRCFSWEAGAREEGGIFIWRWKKGTRMHERGEIGEKLSAGGGTAPSINDTSLF